MFLCVDLDDFDSEKILINNKIKNNIITNSFFYRLYYSDNDFISNGIVIVFTLYDVTFEKYFNKNKLIFNNKKNIENINKLNLLEENLLNALKIDKQKKCLVKEQIDNNFLKIINDRNNVLKQNAHCNIIIKISGIWESTTEYGLTFRCIKTEKKYN